MSKIIWIDRNIYNEENLGYVKELEELGYKKLRLFETVTEAFDYMKSILFDETKIIVSGRLFSEFINTFKANIKDICFIPKIIIFTGNEERFLGYNQDYEKTENKFYTFGAIATIIDEVKDFLKKENTININDDSFFISQMNQKAPNNQNISLDNSDERKETKNDSDVQLTFEYIDSKEKILLPLFFKTLIDKIPNENMEEYTKSLYNIYSKENSIIKELLEQILIMKNIPIEILCKYYARIYTVESNFYKDINKDLRMNNKDKYFPYIKTFYEGVKLKSLPLANNNILYRGTKISNDEIKKIKEYINNKIKNLPSSIVFSKSFLSFTKDKKIAENYLNIKNKENNLSKVLFVLEKDTNIEYNLCTHGDIEKISFFMKEKFYSFLFLLLK